MLGYSKDIVKIRMRSRSTIDVLVPWKYVLDFEGS
jgi:hypothetical protein